jgi:hypothetical protein
MILAIRPGRAIYRARFPGTSMEPRLNFGPYAEAVLSSKSIAISDGHGWSFEARKNCSHKVASRTWPCTTSFTTLRGHNLLPVQTSIRTKTIKSSHLVGHPQPRHSKGLATIQGLSPSSPLLCSFHYARPSNHADNEQGLDRIIWRLL